MQVSQSQPVEPQIKERTLKSDAIKPGKSSAFGRAVRTCAFTAALSVATIFGGRAGAEEATPELPPESPPAVVEPLPAVTEPPGEPTCPEVAPMDDHACPAPDESVPRRACTIHACQLSTFTLIDGEERTSTFIVNEHLPMPEVEITGPATVELRFYPSFLLERFDDAGEVEIGARVAVQRNGDAPETFTFGGISRRTDMEARDFEDADPMVDAEGVRMMAISDHVGGTFDVGAGNHHVAIERTILVDGEEEPINGFLQVVITFRPDAPPPTQTDEASGLGPAPVQPQVQIPEPEPPALMSRVVSLTGERRQFHRLGELTPSADMYYADVFGNPYRINGTLALVAGALFTAYGLPIGTGSSAGAIRSYSVNPAVGIEILSGRHRLDLVGFAGWRGMRLDSFSIQDHRSGDARGDTWEAGGLARYMYDPRVIISVMGSSNPINPLNANLEVNIPFGRSRASMDVAADFMFLQSLAELESVAGGFEIGRNNFFLRGTVAVQYRFGPGHEAEPGRRAWSVIPALMASVDANFIETETDPELDWVDVLAGASLDARINRFVLGVEGQWSALTGRTALVSFNFRYER
ncbi:MAG: hypothetical protein ABII71_05410 [Candidatus Micrarchaeota archaeon]